MIVLLIVEVVVLLTLTILARNKYQTILRTEEAKEYSLHAMLPMALFILELIKYRYASKYDKKIFKIIASLHGNKNADIHMKLYYSNKLGFMLGALVLLTFLGAVAGNADISYNLFMVGAPIIVFYISDKDLENRLKKKYESIRADFPDMVSKLVLLVNAGMTLNRAWEKICVETKKKTPLYLELKTTYLQIQGGKPESEAYEEFARRCRVREITKFVTLIIQNLKKGSDDMVPLLRLQAEECWELRKMRARQLGEEASAKLILPMMIMFIGILIIVVLPAVLQLNSL
ncbi:MAG TPA: type II secretion system F family protein [Patescibacteria group bacterium]|nr:type II secretion system F family protein [Patescibacteria group bacterium]